MSPRVQRHRGNIGSVPVGIIGANIVNEQPNGRSTKVVYLIAATVIYLTDILVFMPFPGVSGKGNDGRIVPLLIIHGRSYLGLLAIPIVRWDSDAYENTDGTNNHKNLN